MVFPLHSSLLDCLDQMGRDQMASHSFLGKGKPLLWDVTVLDTLALLYRTLASTGQGKVAAAAETKKTAKYSSLLSSYVFKPIAVEF